MSTGINALRRVRKRRLRAYSKNWKRLARIIPRYASLGDVKMLRFLKPWLRARKSALEIIFDRTKYPDPPGGVVEAPHLGYKVVMRRLRTLERSRYRVPLRPPSTLSSMLPP